MGSERIDVVAYAGQRGDERPLAFTRDGVRVDVRTVTESRVEEGTSDRTRRRCFRVEGSDGRTHLIACDETTREWYRLS